MARRPVVLDTDIGSDVDDIFALTLLAKAPEVELIGVTTVYGNTPLRSRIARYVCDSLGLPDVPVVSGARDTLTGRPVWWAGHEGEGIPDLDAITIDERASAVDYLHEAARHHAGTLEIAAIGPLTNIAQAISSDATFASRVRHLTIMGGVFSQEEAEHNIKCDPEAADLVFRAGLPSTVVGLDVTKKTWFREADLDAIARSNGQLGRVLVTQLRRWWSYRGVDKAHPHDPLAILTMVRPDLFSFEEGEIHVGLGADDLARTTLSTDGSGVNRVAADVQAEAAEAEMLRRIVA